MLSGTTQIMLLSSALLMASCAVKESATQTQGGSNGNNQPATVNQSANLHSSSGENGKEKVVDYYAHLRPEHREVLREWLKTKGYLRPAVQEVDSILYRRNSISEGNREFLRETVGENGYQYYSVGDMNHDGKGDFAVLLVDTRQHEESHEESIDRFALAIFNAPLTKGTMPAYYEDGLPGISNSYIVFDKVSKKHLFLGKFESDVLCATYYPRKKTYYFKDCME